MNRRAIAAVALAVLIVVAALIAWWPRPGPIVATTTLGGFPMAVAADPETGRFFVMVSNQETSGSLRLITIDGHTGKLIHTEVLASNLTVGLGFLMAQAVLSHGTTSGSAAMSIPGTPLVDRRHGRVVVATPGLALDFDAAPNDSSGSVNVFDATSGRILHTILPSTNPAGMILDEATGHFFVADAANANGITDAENAVSIVDVISGRVLGTIKLDQQPVLMSLDARARRLFVVTAKEPTPGNQTSQQLIAIDLRSNHILYRLPLRVPSGASVDSLALDPAHGRAVVSSLDPSSGGTLEIADTRRGVVMRRVAIGIASAFLLEPRTGRIFVVSSTGGGGALPRTVRLLNPATGGLRPVFTAPEDLDGWLVDTGSGRVLCGGKTHIYLLDARTGARIATIDAHGTVGAIDGRTGHVIVLTPGPNSPSGQGETPVLAGHGAVTVLDGRSGAIVHRVAFGYMPLGAAVDERGGHIAVLDYGATIRAIDPWAWLPGGLRKRLPFIPPPGPTTRTIRPSVGIIDPAR